MSNDLTETIQKRLAQLRMSPEEASRRAGLDKSYLRKMFERGSHPRRDTLGALAEALQLPVEALVSKAPLPEIAVGIIPERSGQAAGIFPQPELRSSTVSPPLPHDMPQNVPVMGTAAGAFTRGAFQLEGGVIDYVRRPPAMDGAKNLYALYIEGSSMEPRFFPGDLVFVHPDRPPRTGDPVVVQVKLEEDRIEATIGHLEKRTPTELVIGKLNPAAHVKLKRDTVHAVHRVLTMNELFGI